MAERCYGKNKLSYVVTARSRGGRIEVFVFHENKSMRRVLRDNSRNIIKLLERYDAFLRSNISAQYWLAKVIEDYRSHFERELVDFTFVTFKRGKRH